MQRTIFQASLPCHAHSVTLLPPHLHPRCRFHPECIGLSAESLPQLQREYFCCPECGKAQATKRLRVA